MALVLLRAWRWIIAAAVLAAAAALIADIVAARALPHSVSVDVPLTGGLPVERRQLLVSIAGSVDVERAAQEKLGTALPSPTGEPGELLRTVTLTLSPTGNSVNIRVTAPSADLARRIALTWAQAFADHVNRLYPRLTDQQTSAYAKYKEADARLAEFTVSSSLSDDSRALEQKQALLRQLSAIREGLSSGLRTRYLTEQDLTRQSLLLSDPIAQVLVEPPTQASLSAAIDRLEAEVADLQKRLAPETARQRELTLQRELYLDVYRELTRKVENARASGVAIDLSDVHFDARGALPRQEGRPGPGRLVSFAFVAGAVLAAGLIVVIDLAPILRRRIEALSTDPRVTGLPDASGTVSHDHSPSDSAAVASRAV